MTNPDVYPVTAAFEEQHMEYLALASPKGYPSVNVYRAMVEAIGEYEHGSFDLPEGTTIQMYADMCDDLLTLLSHNEHQPFAHEDCPACQTRYPK